MTRIVQLKYVGKMVVRGFQSKIKESVAIAFVSYQFHPFPYFFPMGLVLTVSSFPILPSLISVVSIHLPFPRTADYFPKRRQILLQLLVLRPVLLRQFRNAVKRIEKVRCCRLVVGHCQLPVVVGVLVRPLDKEAVLFHLHTLTDGAFRFHKDRETIQLTDRQIFTARCGVLGNLL